MAEKDITERHLTSHNDVFAGVANACISILTKRAFRLIRPEELQDAPTHTIYTSGNEIREQERDVAKYWIAGGAIICLVGLENQTDVDPNMPLRVFSYEGGDYRWQLSQEGQEPHPVLTLVLYFGTERRWPEYLKSLSGRLDFPEALRALLNDCRLNVIELAWLTDEELALFEGDFRFVLEVLRSIRLGRKIVLTDQVIKHVDATLRLLSALTGERRLENLPTIKRGEPMTVRNIFAETWDEIRKEGIILGREEGISLGREQGISLGREEGISLGREQGFLNALCSLVNDGMIPITVAAAKANMSEDEFKARMQTMNPGQKNE